MKCSHHPCNYEWNYEGISVIACCPRCRKYTKVPDVRAHLERLAKQQSLEFKKKEEGMRNERKPQVDRTGSQRRKPNSPS